MKIFANVAQMRLAHLTAGQHAETIVYSISGDNGGARYLIEASQAVDDINDHNLSGGTVAILQGSPSFTDAEIDAEVPIVDFSKESENVLRYGKNTVPGVTDMTEAFNNAWLVSNPAYAFVPAASYEIPGTVTGNFYTIGAVTIVTGTVDTIVNVIVSGGGIANVVEDTSPQLGSALDGLGRDLNNMGVLFLTEQTSAETDIPDQGQLWVRAVTPNELWFTHDDGVDVPLDPTRSPINVQNGDYTLVLADRGRTIHKVSGGAGETYTIPENDSIPYANGTLICFQNDGGGDLSIVITSDDLIGTDGSVGNKVLGSNHTAVIQKMASTTWKYVASDL